MTDDCFKKCRQVFELSYTVRCILPLQFSISFLQYIVLKIEYLPVAACLCMCYMLSSADLGPAGASLLGSKCMLLDLHERETLRTTFLCKAPENVTESNQCAPFHEGLCLLKMHLRVVLSWFALFMHLRSM